jgi:hypothetical protein
MDQYTLEADVNNMMSESKKCFGVIDLVVARMLQYKTVASCSGNCHCTGFPDSKKSCRCAFAIQHRALI